MHHHSPSREKERLRSLRKNEERYLLVRNQKISRNEGMLPQRELETELIDPNFPHYILPRRTDAREGDLPKKAVTTLVSPRVPLGVTLLQDILPKLARLKFQDFDT